MASVKLIDVFKTFDGSKYVVDGISADIDNMLLPVNLFASPVVQIVG
jgi:hypothetical protein